MLPSLDFLRVVADLVEHEVNDLGIGKVLTKLLVVQFLQVVLVDGAENVILDVGEVIALDENENVKKRCDADQTVFTRMNEFLDFGKDQRLLLMERLID